MTSGSVGADRRDPVRTLGVDRPAVGTEPEVPRVRQPGPEDGHVELGRPAPERERVQSTESVEHETPRPIGHQREATRNVPARPRGAGPARHDARNSDVMHRAEPVEDETTTVVRQQRDVGANRCRENVRERQARRTRRDTESDPAQRTVRGEDVRARSIRREREPARRVDSWVIRSRRERVDGRRAAEGMHATEPIQHVPARRASKRNATGDVPSLPVGSVGRFRRCRVAVEPKTVEATEPVEDKPAVAVRRDGDAARDVPVRPVRQTARHGGRRRSRGRRRNRAHPRKCETDHHEQCKHLTHHPMVAD